MTTTETKTKKPRVAKTAAKAGQAAKAPNPVARERRGAGRPRRRAHRRKQSSVAYTSSRLREQDLGCLC